jgi:hypothetical protein
MSNTLRNMSLAVALMVLSAPMLGTEVQAKESFMKACSTKYKAAKAANSAEGNMKWTDFMKTQCAADAAVVEPAPVEPAPMVKPAKAAKVKAAAPAAPAATTVATPSGSFLQNCSAAWKDLKAKNAVPAGMAWKDFVAAKCVVTGAPAPAVTPVSVKKKPAAVDTTMDPTPSEPDATNANQEPLKTVDKNGKAFTPGQMAAHQRARDCGAKWRANKPAFQAQYGTWPKYWSACNTEMKAAQ